MKIQNNKGLEGRRVGDLESSVWATRKVTAYDFYSKHATSNGCLESPQKTKVGLSLLWES